MRFELLLLSFFLYSCALTTHAASTPPQTPPLCIMNYDDDIKIYDVPVAQRNFESEKIEPVGVLSEREIFTCFRDAQYRTMDGEIIIPGKNGKKLYAYLPPTDEVASYKQIEHMGNSYLQVNAKGKANLPQQIYLDGSPAKVVQFFDKEGVSFRDVEDNKAKGVAWPSVNDKSKAYFVRETKFVTDYQDPIQHKTVGRMFYKVDIVANDKKSIAKYLKGELPADKSGWVDSEVTRFDELIYKPDTTPEPPADYAVNENQTEAKADCCEIRAPMDVTKAKVEELKTEIKPPSGEAKSAAELVKGNACFTSETSVKKNKKGGQTVADAYENMAKSHYKNQPQQAATDLTAIDMYARTIYGEMRSCHHNLGSRYSKAQARIALNRAQKCQKNKNCGFSSRKVAGASLSEAMIGILGRSKQFSVWNSNDKNLDNILCVSKSSTDKKIWEDAVDIASQAILDTRNFRWNTRSVGDSTYHYVSAYGALRWRDPSWAANMSRVDDIRIDGLPVDKASCLRAYSTRQVSYLEPKELFLPEEKPGKNLYALSICPITDRTIR